MSHVVYVCEMCVMHVCSVRCVMCAVSRRKKVGANTRYNRLSMKEEAKIAFVPVGRPQ